MYVLQCVVVVYLINLIVASSSLTERASPKAADGNKTLDQLEEALIKLILSARRQGDHFPADQHHKTRVLRQESSSIFGNFKPAVVREEVRKSLSGHLTCVACKIGMSFIKLSLSAKSSQTNIHARLLRTCVRFKIQPEKVCTGLLDTFMDELYFILSHTPLSSKEICAAAVGAGCGSLTRRQQWKVQLSSIPKPRVARMLAPQPNVPTANILHISDTHIDWLYKEGAPADCDDIMCCREDSIDGDTSRPAGKWGDFGKCNIPRKTIEDMFRFIRRNHKIEYIFWTGDIPPHDVWRQNRPEQLASVKDTIALIRNFFPRTTVLPVVGNHEAMPPNSFPPSSPEIPEKFSISWLYEALWNEWRKWLPRSTRSTILSGGYYSVQLKPGLRVISVNTNFCYFANWWLLLNIVDPGNQLRWLVDALQEAEDWNHKVYIIGHVAPGSPDCAKVWSENFYRIINRYESTVVAQFYGHSHKDEFEVFYDETNKKRAINVAYIGPSVTTFTGLNPACRLYKVAGDQTYSVLDHETYMMDLDEANRIGLPLWKMMYSAKEAYKLPSLQPQEWSNLVDRMTRNKTLFDQFYSHYHRNSRHFTPCSRSCQKRLLCSLKSGKSQDPSLCVG